jgi:hypothetical protein
MPGWLKMMRLKQAERKLVDALGMYAAAYADAEEVDRSLSAARMQEMVRGTDALRRAFDTKAVAPRD